MTATTTDSAGAAEPPEKVLEFTITDERYCVDIDEVAEIVQPGDITTMPDTPPEIEGVMNLRSEATTILDPRVVFEMGEDDVENQKVIIFDSGDDQQIGWLVTQVDRVTELSDPEVDPALDNRYISGIVSDGEQLVLWIDPVRVNTSHESEVMNPENPSGETTGGEN